MKRNGPTPAPSEPPPAHLSERARALWASVVPRRASSPERLALIQIALESLDRANSVAEVIARDGMTTTTKTTGAVHINPLLKLEYDNRQLFSKIWLELSLGWSNEIDRGF